MNVFEDAAQNPKNTEVYELVTTAIIVRNDRRYRIEVLKGYSNENIPFTTRTHVEEEISDDKKVFVHIDAP